jgi:hypothetical protein
MPCSMHRATTKIAPRTKNTIMTTPSGQSEVVEGRRPVKVFAQQVLDLAGDVGTLATPPVYDGVALTEGLVTRTETRRVR